MRDIGGNYDLRGLVFCYQTKLSPQDTDEYLNLMFALENEHVPMDTKVMH